MPEHVLAGCQPVPLASYLKALAVLRLVGEDADPDARGFWRDDTFVLRTTLDRDALLHFFLYDYRPTPIIAPWNGGSGFYYREGKTKVKDPSTGKLVKTGTRDQPTAATRALDAIAESKAGRLSRYRHVVDIARVVLKRLGLTESPKDESKAALVNLLRGTMPDESIEWLDAALLLAGSTPSYPPLLAAGGTDGNLDFTKNFMERLGDLMDLESGAPHDLARSTLVAALDDEVTEGLGDAAIGQFSPSASGGANAGVGFEGASLCNPWDFVLAVEGTVLFAAAAVRRCGRPAPGALTYPFTVRMLALGYHSSAATDEKHGKDGNTRGEMWLPMWGSPVSLPELRALLNEGRAQVSGRPVRHTVDFARAVSTLGVDRGIASFQRYAFHVRKGSTALATPLDRFRVHEQPTVRLLDEIDWWLDSFRRRATSDRAPASARRLLGALEEAMVDLCRRGGPDRVQAVLVALGQCERTMARSLRWVTDPKAGLTPVPPLSPAWLAQADDGSAEFRLAAALGSVVAVHEQRHAPLRRQMEAVATHQQRGRLRVEWDKKADRDVVWTDGDLAAALNAVLGRRLILSQQSGVRTYSDRAAQPARPGDVAEFIEDRTDDSRLAALLWGSILIDWPRCDRPPFADQSEVTALPALYGLLKLCFPGALGSNEPAIPVVPRIHRLAASGDGAEASRQGVRRLRASGHSPAVEVIHHQGDAARRVAAAVLFPLAPGALAAIRRTVLRPSTTKER